MQWRLASVHIVASKRPFLSLSLSEFCRRERPISNYGTDCDSNSGICRISCNRTGFSGWQNCSKKQNSFLIFIFCGIFLIARLLKRIMFNFAFYKMETRLKRLLQLKQHARTHTEDQTYKQAYSVTKFQQCTSCNYLQVTTQRRVVSGVVSTPASYLGSPGFKSRPGDRLSWLRFLWFSSVPPGKFRDSNKN
jgi:hypothetical protein